MALESGMREAVRRVVMSFHRYAKSQGWQKEDYRVYYETNPDWGRIHVVLGARRFPRETTEENWLSVIDFIDEDLKDSPELLDAISLTLRTFDQLEGRGLYALNPSYVDSEDVFDSAGST